MENSSDKDKLATEEDIYMILDDCPSESSSPPPPPPLPAFLPDFATPPPSYSPSVPPPPVPPQYQHSLQPTNATLQQSTIPSQQPTVYTSSSYMTPGGQLSSPVSHPGTHYTHVTQTTIHRDENVSSIRRAIPALPMGLAIALCVINCIFPGIGTIIAGFSIFCCGNKGQKAGGRFGTFCVNFWVGIAQLATAMFLVGWIWSVMWGVAFIVISGEDKKSREKHYTTTTITSHPILPQPNHKEQYPPRV